MDTGLCTDVLDDEVETGLCTDVLDVEVETGLCTDVLVEVRITGDASGTWSNQCKSQIIFFQPLEASAKSAKK